MAQQNLSDADTGPVAKSKIQSNFTELYAADSTHAAAADPHPAYALESSLATVATTGAYTDLTGKPTLGTAAATDATAYATAAQAVPAGGSLGQVLAKASASDYDAEWQTPSGGGGSPGGIDTQYQINNAGAFGGGNLFQGTNIVDLRNGTAAQTFRIERSFTDVSNRGYTELRQDATTGFILDSVNLGSVGAPTNLLDVRVNGASRLKSEASGRLVVNASGTQVMNLVNGLGTAFLLDVTSSRADVYFSGGNGFSFTNTGAVVSVLEGEEIADPAAPSANRGRVYYRDNGSGKTQLCVRFATGSVQVIATEP